MRRVGICALLAWAASVCGQPPHCDDRPLDGARARAYRQLFEQHLKERVALGNGPESSFARYLCYFDEYFADLGTTPGVPATLPELLQEANRHRLVLLGDLHDVPACRRNHEAVLRELARTRKVVLALECVPVQLQRELDDFATGKLKPEEFRGKLTKFWPYFNEPSWLTLLELARKQGWRMVPLEDVEPPHLALMLQGKTARRDARTADRLVKLLDRCAADEVVCVIYGAYHLAGAGHLPDELARRGQSAFVVTCFAPAQHLDEAARRGGVCSILRLGAGRYYLPCLAGDSLAQVVSDCSRERTRESFDLLRQVEYFRLRELLNQRLAP